MYRDSMFGPKIIISHMDDSKYNLLIRTTSQKRTNASILYWSNAKCPLFRDSTVLYKPWVAIIVSLQIDVHVLHFLDYNVPPF